MTTIVRRVASHLGIPGVPEAAEVVYDFRALELATQLELLHLARLAPEGALVGGLAELSGLAVGTTTGRSECATSHMSIIRR